MSTTTTTTPRQKTFTSMPIKACRALVKAARQDHALRELGDMVGYSEHEGMLFSGHVTSEGDLEITLICRGFLREGETAS